jgi:CBS domain-containing protein
MTITLRQVLDAKGSGVVSVLPSEPSSEAVAQMCRHSIGCVLAMSGGMLQGIFTERDAMRRLLAARLDPRTTPVGTVMSRNVVCAATDTTLDEAMRIMTTGRHRHLPVMERGTVLGIVSIGDMVKWTAQDLEQHVMELSVLVAGPCAQPELPTLPPLPRPRVAQSNRA